MTVEEINQLQIGDLVLWTGKPYPKQLAVMMGKTEYKVLKSVEVDSDFVGHVYFLRYNEWESAVKIPNKVGKILYG